MRRGPYAHQTLKGLRTSKDVFFLVLASWSLVGGHESFGRIYRLHLQGILILHLLWNLELYVLLSITVVAVFFLKRYPSKIIVFPKKVILSYCGGMQETNLHLTVGVLNTSALTYYLRRPQMYLGLSQILALWRLIDLARTIKLVCFEVLFLSLFLQVRTHEFASV